MAAAFQLYQQAVDVGLVELAPRTRVTVRSAVNTMSSTLLADGGAFGEPGRSPTAARGVRIVRKPTKRADWRDVPLTDSAVSARRPQWDRRREMLGVEPPAGSYVFAGAPPAIRKLRELSATGPKRSSSGRG